MNNTTTDAGRQVRGWPHWKINEALRRKGFNHFMIAERAGTSESTVSHVIRRRRKSGEAVERVWVELVKALTA